MIERCPCCNARLKGSVICPRCTADLNLILDSKKTAQYWLSKAVQSLADNEVEKSVIAINFSLHLSRTKIATVFYDFLVFRQCNDILELLAQDQVLVAKKILYNARVLIPHSKQLQQLDLFTNYLIITQLR